MATLKGKKATDELKRIKSNIEASLTAFSSNNKKYWESKKFIYVTAMTDRERSIATKLGRPTLESNSLEPYIVRQVAEVSRQLPDPFVQPKIPNDATKADQAQIIEDHMRHLFEKASNIIVESFKSAADGGFYIFKVIPDYISPKSKEMAPSVQRVFNVTKAGFDPLAKESHKGDGRYSWEEIPMLKEDFENEYDIELDDALFSSSDSKWFYIDNSGDQKQKVVCVRSYYEKKTIYKTIYTCTNPLHPDYHMELWEEEYDEMIKKLTLLNKSPGEIPQILKETKRKTYEICNYDLIGNRILSYEKLDWIYLPHVFCDGRSETLEDNNQITRSLVYQSMDVQKAMNITFQTIMNDIENKEQTKTYLPIAGLPEKGQFLDSWLKIQTPHAARFWNHKDENGDEIPGPQPIMPIPLDGAMIQWYMEMKNAIQMCQGSFDTHQGIQTDDMSGVAIDKGAVQSNNASLINLINFKQAWTQAAQIILSLIPQYYTTAKSIPLIDREGNRSYKIINDSMTNPYYKIEYSEDDMDVDVKMDLSFEAQKSIASRTIEGFMRVSPLFNKFFSTDGANFLLDNATFRDLAKVKQAFSQFMQKEAKNSVQSQQSMMATNPVVAQTKIAEMKMDSEEKDRKMDLIKIITDAKLQERKIELEEEKVQASIIESRDRVVNEAMKTDAENARSEAEAAMALDKHAYDQLESERKHALKVRDSDRDHVLKMIEMIGDRKNEKATQENQEGNAQGNAEERMLGEENE